MSPMSPMSGVLPLAALGFGATLVALGALVSVTVFLFARRGWKDLQQARVLADPVPPGALGWRVGQAVTVVGRPLSLHEEWDPFYRNYVWYERVYQEWQHSSSRGSARSYWATRSVEPAKQDFALEVGGGVSLVVSREASEAHDVGVQELPSESGHYRTLIRYYPKETGSLTVCGKLVRDGDGFRIEPDPAVGLLLARGLPRDRARREALKGWTLLVGPPLIILAGFVAFLLMLP